MNLVENIARTGLNSVFETGTERDALLVILHGRGDSPGGFSGFREELGLARIPTLLLQAPDPYGPGYSWYPLPPDHGPGVLRSRKLLEDAFAAIEASGFAPARTVLLGFSQGCLMTLEFGARHPKRLAGYVGLSGYAYDVEGILRDATPAARAGDWLVTHGTEDEVLPVERTRAQVAALRAGGLPIDYREYPMGHTIDQTREMPDLRTWLEARFRNEVSPKK